MATGLRHAVFFHGMSFDFFRRLLAPIIFQRNEKKRSQIFHYDYPKRPLDAMDAGSPCHSGKDSLFGAQKGYKSGAGQTEQIPWLLSTA